MAGNFTINVVVTGAGTGGGSGTSGGRRSGGIDESAVAGFAAGNQTAFKANEVNQVRKSFADISRNTYDVTNKIRSELGMKQYNEFLLDEKTGQFGASAIETIGGSDRYISYTVLEGQAIQKLRNKSFFLKEKYGQNVVVEEFFIDLKTGESFGDVDSIERYRGMTTLTVGTSGLEDHLKKHSKRYGALLTATAVKTASEVVAFYQHTSGDAYFNAQLSNAARLAAYGSAIAFSGPLMPFVATGLAISEAISLVGDAMKYDFNRKIERAEITNNMIAAGNASYGRMRGVGV